MLARAEAGIRNLRYRKGLAKRTESETKVLFQQKDELQNSVKVLQDRRHFLAQDVTDLKKVREKLKGTINVDKFLLQGVLAQALTNLKQKRPDLFTLTGQDQIVSLARLFLVFTTQQLFPLTPKSSVSIIMYAQDLTVTSFWLYCRGNSDICRMIFYDLFVSFPSFLIHI
ncbi:MAG: hypothetical protein PVF15_03550 [Candidatus Bathyarchaeota archaeon]|jgi:hypothetical protein